MRILLFTTGYIEIVFSLANALSKISKTKLMLPKSAAVQHLPKDYTNLVSRELDFETFDMPRFSSIKNTRFVFNMVRRIRSFNPSVIHLQDMGHPWFILGYPYFKKYPIVSTIHDPEPHLGDGMNKSRVFANAFGKILPDEYIVHGHKVKDDLKRVSGISNDKISVIPFGGFPVKNIKEFDKIPERENTVLFFGRIWPYKGLEYLIKAEPFIRAEIPDIKIIIAGSGESMEKYIDLIRRKESFEIINEHIPYEKVMSLFKSSSLVVVPYVEATQSSIPPLAFQFGKPVVVTDVGALGDIVEDGKQGFVVPPKDEKSLAESIVKILTNGSLRRKMGKSGKSKIMNELSYDKIAEKTLKVYKKVLTAKHNK